MQDFDIYVVKFYYSEDKSKYKYRPALVINDTLRLVAKITGNTDIRSNADYIIKDWNAAGLDKPSRVKLDDALYLKPDSSAKYLGHLSEKDSNNIKKMLKYS